VERDLIIIATTGGTLVMIAVTIQIIYRSALSGCKILQGGSFPLKGRKVEKVAFDWWKQIQREMNVDRLEQVLCDGEDITQLVKNMDIKK
jgi:hypothetical protein